MSCGGAVSGTPGPVRAVYYIQIAAKSHVPMDIRAGGGHSVDNRLCIGERVKDLMTGCAPEVADLVSGAGLTASRVGSASALTASFL